jgi:hypothetical protein
MAVRSVWASPPSAHDLGKVQRGMFDDDVYYTIGLPDFRTGSGVRIEVYELRDGEQFCAWYSSGRVSRFRLVDRGNRLNTIAR